MYGLIDQLLNDFIQIKMRIVILSPSDRSYIKNFLPNYDPEDLPVGYIGAPFIGSLIQELLKRNHVVIAITTNIFANNDYKTKEFSHERFKWVVVPQRKRSFRSNNGKPGFMLDYFSLERKKMLKVVKKEAPNFIHAHWSYEFAAVANMIDIPSLVTIHDNPYVVLKYFKNAYRFGRLLMSEKVLSKVNFSSTVSPYMIHYAKRKCTHVKVIPNPINIKFAMDQIKVFVEKRIATLNKPKIIMVNSGWDSRKNGKKALITFQKLLKSCPYAHLHLIGGGSEINGLAHMEARSLGIKNVVYHGIIPNEQLFKELESAHLFLHTALEESFGVVLIEAMSLGVPTIGGIESGAVPWVIEDKNLLVDVRDPVQIRDKVIEILTNSQVYEKTSYSSYQMVKERFSASEVTEKYLDYYKEIILSHLRN